MSGPLFTGIMDDAQAEPTHEKPGALEWWPTSHLDEIMNSGRADPSDWIMTLEGGRFAYGGPSVTEMESVTEGETVSFSSCQTLSYLEMVIHEDGSFVLDKPEPIDATHWYDEDCEDIQDTAQALAKSLFESIGAGTHDVSTARWSHTDFRFEVTDGVGCFVRVEPAA